MQGAGYRYSGTTDQFNPSYNADDPFGRPRKPDDPYNRSRKPDPYSRNDSSDKPYRPDPYSRPVRPDSYARDDPLDRPQRPNSYARDDPSGRPQKPDPYSQQRSANPYELVNDLYAEDDYPIRGQKQAPAGRQDPYSRQPRADPYSNAAPSSDKRHRNDMYSRDDPFDERDAPLPVSRGPLDYRDFPDRSRGDDNSQRPGQRQLKPRVEPVANIKGPSVVHELDHLATFTVNKRQGIFRPDDGIRRLRDMEATSGIWAMRVQLKIDRQEVVVIEKADNKELECFAVSQITEPQCIATSDSNDLYNNIVLFTANRAPAEMHLFQCVGKSGQEVVDDLIAAMSGKFPRPPKPAPIPAVPSFNSLDDDRSVSSLEDLAYNRPFQANSQPPFNGSDAGSRAVKQPTQENNDVILMNHCFDDIEGFVSSLQQAANAQKEIDRRLATNPQDPAVGMLLARAQPPPLKDFVDVLQKFKTTFNLLSNIGPMLKDPDSVQLVHMLFSLLKLVTDACRDERGTLNVVVQQVESPMLTGDTCVLLQSNLQAYEMQLWQSLGPAWTTPAHLWRGDVPPYYPRFKDGWQHPAFVGKASAQDHGMMFGGVPMTNTTGQSIQPSLYGNQFDPRSQSVWQGNANGLQVPQSNVPMAGQNQSYQQGPVQGFQPGSAPFNQEPTRGGFQPSPVPVAQGNPSVPAPDTPESERRASSTTNPSQQRFLAELQAKGAQICTVTHDRDGANAKELTVKTGDVLEVVDSSKNWWKVKNHMDQSGYVPNTILAPFTA